MKRFVKKIVSTVLVTALVMGALPTWASAAAKTLEYVVAEPSVEYLNEENWREQVTVTAHYTDGTEEDVTNDPNTLVQIPYGNFVGEITAYAMFTYGDTTVYDTFTTNRDGVVSMEFTPPTKRVYNLDEDSIFDPTGIRLERQWYSGGSDVITDFTYEMQSNSNVTEITEGGDLDDYYTNENNHGRIHVRAKNSEAGVGSWYTLIINESADNPTFSDDTFVSIEIIMLNQYDYIIGDTFTIPDVYGILGNGDIVDISDWDGFTYGIGEHPSVKTQFDTLGFNAVHITYKFGGGTHSQGSYVNVLGKPAVIAFNTNGGNTINANVFREGDTISSGPSNPTKSGYTFAGWYSDAAFKNKVTFPYKVPTGIEGGMATLHAKWTSVTATDNNNNNNTGGGGGNVIYNNNTTTTPTTNTSKAVETAIKAGGDVVLAPGKAGEVSISKDNMAAIVEAKADIVVQTDDAQLNISPEVMEAAGINGGADVKISFAPTTEILLPQANQETLAGIDPINEKLLESRVYDVSIAVGGKAVTSFSTPLELVFDLKDFDLSPSQESRLTAVRINEDGTINQLGGRLEGGSFKAKTSKTSQYGIIISDSLKSVSLSIDKSAYTVNGVKKTSDVTPSIINDRTMVPVRFIAEALGAEVDWEGDTQTVTIALDGKETQLTIGKLSAGMDTPPVIVNDRTLVPLRYIAEALDSNVIYNEKDRSIEVYR